MEASISTPWIVTLVILAVWDMVWRGIALWKSGHHDQKGWFIALLIVNSAGILPILYIVFWQKGKSKKGASSG